MNLTDLLCQIDLGQVMWAFPNKTLRARVLRDAVDACQQLMPYDENSRIALEVSDIESGLIWMLALDGVVGTVFLVPDSLQRTDEYSDLKKKFNASTTITENISINRECSLGIKKIGALGTGRVSTRWVLATSGTSGTPKLVEHTTESLTRTCKVNNLRSKDFTWGLTYDPFRFAGLQVVLQALAGGSRLVFANTVQTLSEQASFMKKHGVNALSATPTYWRKLLISSELKGHSLKQITLGGEPSDQNVLNALASAFPGARITHIYASTEVGVGFSVTDGKAGFPRDYLVTGVAGNQLSISGSGTLMIKPEKHTSASSISGTFVNKDGFVDTGDLVEQRDDRVYFIGRDSGSINVGGNKVIPEEVEAVIREVDGVAEVVVKPQNSGIIGQLVLAEVQLLDEVSDKKNLKQKIILHCRAHLEKFKVPALVKFVAEIKNNPTGKLNRK